MSRVQAVVQTSLTECGLCCCVMVLRAAGVRTSLLELRAGTPAGRDGLSLTALAGLLRSHGLTVRSFRADRLGLRRLPGPLIAFWRGSHFVVVERVGRRAVDVVDPLVGRRRLTGAEFDRDFSGIVLAAAGAPPRAQRPAPAGRRPRPREVALGAVAAIGQLLVWAGVPVAALLCWDGRPLPAVAALLVAAAGVPVRSAAAAALVGTWSVDAARDLHRRVLRQSPQFHRVQPAGDLLTLSGRLLAAPDDVVTRLLPALSAGGAWLVSAALLSRMVPGAALALVLTAALLLPLNRWYDRVVRRPRTREAEQIQEAHARLLARTAALRDGEPPAPVDDRQLALLASAGGSGAVRAARRVVARALGSAGTAALLTAGAALAAQVPGRPAATAVTAVTLLLAVASPAPAALVRARPLLRYLRTVHADVRALNTLTGGAGGSERPTGAAPPAVDPGAPVELRGVELRHTASRPPVLRGVDLRVRPGRVLAVTGASGSGGTSLARLLVGELRPDQGELVPAGPAVLVDRRCVVGGRLADHVAGTSGAGVGAVDRALRVACAAEEVADLPMGGQTVVTDGQRDLPGSLAVRLAVARAVCAGTSLLVLDDVLDAMDGDLKARLLRNLRGEGLRTVVVTRDPAVRAAADDVVVVREGRVHPEAAVTGVTASR